MIADTSPRALAAAMIGRPLAMAPDAATAAVETLDALNLTAMTPPTGRAAAERSYVTDREGVATIAVHGQLVGRASWLSQLLGFSAYDELRRALAATAADPAVKGVLLDFDSPGGDLAGAVETANAVRALQARKPVVAYIDSLAASAAYVIAAAAGRVIATPSATLGSIGVVMLHMDRSAALAKRGVKPTLLHAGAFKTDGHSLAPLPPDARARIESHLSEAHTLILGSIGLHRPALGVAGARKTEAGVYMGGAAVAAGLADAVGTLETARAFLLSRSSPPAAPAAVLPLSPPPATAVSPSLSSPSAGAMQMSAAAHLDKSSALGFIVSSGLTFPQATILRALKKDERRAEANAMVGRQASANSADANNATDSMWREIIDKQARPSAFRGAHR